MSENLWKTNLDKPSEHNDLLLNIVKSGHLAPSSHNTQPWLFKISSPEKIELYADKNQKLNVADPTFKEMYISCGCALANMEITSLNYGLDPKIEILPDKNNSDLIASLTLAGSSKTSPLAELHPYIQHRMVNRSHYDNSKKIPQSVIEECQTIIKDLNTSLHFVMAPEKVSLLATINKEGIFKALSDPLFRKELSLWVRHNWTNKGDGLTGETLGLSNVISLLLPLMVTSDSLAKTSSQDEEKAILSSSACAIISAPKDDYLHWIHAGIAYERIALLLTKYKIDTALLTAAIEVPSSKIKLKEFLGEKLEPQMFFRIGYSTKKMPHSPRRPIEKVLIS